MTTPTSGLPHYLVEWYRPEPNGELLDRTTAFLEHAIRTLSAEGCPVRLLMTVAVPADEVIFGVFAAGSAQVVEQVCRRAGVPSGRLSTAETRCPEPRAPPRTIGVARPPARRPGQADQRSPL
ncbi:hypothetical protein [Pseudonocardia spinosispora]|uniref:hypothetical protein n=1 Tax=Pseudonocardia spinosispora TaxID=103441 RepID=UPI00041E7952|nr:hypothetical protein [Pseudonocardia spinosispora]